MTVCLIVYYVIGAYVRCCCTLAGFGLSDLDSPFIWYFVLNHAHRVSIAQNTPQYALRQNLKLSFVNTRFYLGIRARHQGMIVLGLWRMLLTFSVKITITESPAWRHQGARPSAVWQTSQPEQGVHPNTCSCTHVHSSSSRERRKAAGDTGEAWKRKKTYFAQWGDRTTWITVWLEFRLRTRTQCFY